MDHIKETSEKKEVAALLKDITLKVFVVDDDEYFNTILKSYIDKIGEELNIKMEVKGFLNGAACLEKIVENPDFVILDFYLDENNDITLTGYDVLEGIKKHNPNIKVTIISQMHEWENFKEEFIKFGASGFLKKDDQLYENLKEMINNSNIDII